MASFALYFLCVLLPYLLWNGQALFVNYRKAQRSGFPFIVCPVNTNSTLWMIISIILRPLLQKLLPESTFDRWNASIYGWEFQSRYRIFARLGPAFILVTTRKNELMVADPEMVYNILSRRNDFGQLDIAIDLLGLFGPNIVTVDGDDWTRQRKIVTPLLTERMMDSVWTESVKQASAMLDSYTGASKPKTLTQAAVYETDSTIPGVRSIAINVLGAIAYGAETSWQQKHSHAPPGFKLSYMECVLTVAENFVPATFVPVGILTSPVMPQTVRRIGYAVVDFPRHMRKLLEAERKSGDRDKVNIMSTLVRVSDAQNFDTDGNSKIKLYMSESELTGNLFQFTLAGYDTTANTMAYALMNLALSPKWQEWICEEFDRELPVGSSRDYEKTFPRLKRTRALMVCPPLEDPENWEVRLKLNDSQFETLRLFTPVAHISRETKTEQQIQTGSKTYTVPANCTIYLNSACTHINPAIWGPDALEFCPDRWLTDDGNIMRPTRGTFTPWSSGPRICPGQKMAEVEFVAVMMTIFTSHKISPVIEAGETLEMAQVKLRDVIADSQPRITLQVNRPQDVKLRWEKRDGK